MDAKMGWAEKVGNLKDLRRDLAGYSKWLDTNIKQAMAIDVGLSLPSEMNRAVFHLEKALSEIEKIMKDDKPQEECPHEVP